MAGMRENLYKRMIDAKKMRWKSYSIAASKNIAPPQKQIMVRINRGINDTDVHIKLLWKQCKKSPAVNLRIKMIK